MIPVKNYMLILLLFLPNSIIPQNFIYFSEICQFENATSFSINASGFLFIADAEKNEITKTDTLGNIIRTIGGYGWQASSFDNPAAIFSNTLNVYVADKNNDRIQIFDKDLNFLSLIKSGDSNSGKEFMYPSGVGVSNQGELFVLDSDDTRILKYNLRGEYQLQIGSYDAGNYSLNHPEKFTVTADQRLYVIDENYIVIFDQFGNGLSKIKLDFTPININSSGNGITMTDGKRIYFINRDNESGGITFNTFRPEIKNAINDALLFNGKLYILTPKNILIYTAAN
jgi:hypothetical protein